MQCHAAALHSTPAPSLGSLPSPPCLAQSLNEGSCNNCLCRSVLFFAGLNLGPDVLLSEVFGRWLSGRQLIGKWWMSSVEDVTIRSQSLLLTLISWSAWLVNPRHVGTGNSAGLKIAMLHLHDQKQQSPAGCTSLALLFFVPPPRACQAAPPSTCS
mmetsp:Transcript_15663/g.34239  ORF Transcript_15663/g.34239 Transcript_15663/m.34239 type:complete len:156 (-) Transcript_15663:4-471(-)